MLIHEVSLLPRVNENTTHSWMHSRCAGKTPYRRSDFYSRLGLRYSCTTQRYTERGSNRSSDGAICLVNKNDLSNYMWPWNCVCGVVQRYVTVKCKPDTMCKSNFEEQTQSSAKWQGMWEIAAQKYTIFTLLVLPGMLLRDVWLVAR